MGKTKNLTVGFSAGWDQRDKSTKKTALVV